MAICQGHIPRIQHLGIEQLISDGKPSEVAFLGQICPGTATWTPPWPHLFPQSLPLKLAARIGVSFWWTFAKMTDTTVWRVFASALGEPPRAHRTAGWQLSWKWMQMRKCSPVEEGDEGSSQNLGAGLQSRSVHNERPSKHTAPTRLDVNAAKYSPCNYGLLFPYITGDSETTRQPHCFQPRSGGITTGIVSATQTGGALHPCRCDLPRMP